MPTIRSAIWPSRALRGLGRPPEPVGEATFRDPEDPAHNAHLPLSSMVLGYQRKRSISGCEKMASAFFSLSRAFRRISFSRRKRRTSSASGWRFPLPTKALSPCSAASVHQRESVLIPIPRSSAICLWDFPPGGHQEDRFLLKRLLVCLSRCHCFLASRDLSLLLLLRLPNRGNYIRGCRVCFRQAHGERAEFRKRLERKLAILGIAHESSKNDATHGPAEGVQTFFQFSTPLSGHFSVFLSGLLGSQKGIWRTEHPLLYSVAWHWLFIRFTSAVQTLNRGSMLRWNRPERRSAEKGLICQQQMLAPADACCCEAQKSMLPLLSRRKPIRIHAQTYKYQ
jgi:hypothetical protein